MGKRKNRSKAATVVKSSAQDGDHDGGGDDDGNGKSLNLEEGRGSVVDEKRPKRHFAKRPRVAKDKNDEGNESSLPSSSSDASIATVHNRKPLFTSDGRYHDKRRCLALCSRGVTARYRHLMEDLRSLMPHHKKEGKLDVGKRGAGGRGGGHDDDDDLYYHGNDDDVEGRGGGVGSGLARALNDVADVRGCNYVLFLECRGRGRDAYLWLGRTLGSGAGSAASESAHAPTESDKTMPLSLPSSGPSVKFHVTNVHTMDELRLTGNCMKGSRPVLSFDSMFDRRDDLRLIKALFVDVFGSPRGHPKSKPFVDRVMAFYWVDRKIWVRNYQILRTAPENALEARANAAANKQSSVSTFATNVPKGKGAGGGGGGGHESLVDDRTTTLVEIGPRFVLDPIRIFGGSFGGQTLRVYPNFVKPNIVRARAGANRGNAFVERIKQKEGRKKRVQEYTEKLPLDPLAHVFD